MYIFLFVCLLLLAASPAKADNSLDADIEKLPAEVKQQLYERIARRIFNEVKVKKVSNESEVLVTKEQLQEQDAFIKKLLKEEQKKLRRTFDNLAKNGTKPAENNLQKNETEDDKKLLRNENPPMAFIDFTKRASLRRNAGSQDIDSKIYTVKPEIKVETSTQGNQARDESSVPNSDIKNSSSTVDTNNSTPSSKLSENTQNTSSVDTVTSASNITALSENITDIGKDETMIQIDSLPDNPKSENVGVTHEFRAKDEDGDHVIKYLNISLLRQRDENQNETISNVSEILDLKSRSTQPGLNLSSEPTKTPELHKSSLNFRASDEFLSLSFENITTTSDRNAIFKLKEDANKDVSTNLSPISEKVEAGTTTIKDEISTFPSETTTVIAQTTIVPTETTTVPIVITTVPAVITTVQEETTTIKRESISTATPKNDAEEKDLNLGNTKRSNNEEISIKINVESNQKEIETTTVNKNIIEMTKSDTNSVPVSNEPKKEIDVNVNVSIGEKSPNKVVKITKIDLTGESVKKKEVEQDKPTATVQIELIADVSEIPQVAPVFKENVYEVVKPDIVLQTEERSKKNNKNVMSGRPEPYIVFEAPPEVSAFKPEVEIQEPVEPSNVEEPEVVPVHNYAPENAYYNPHKYYASDSNENQPINLYTNGNKNAKNNIKQPKQRLKLFKSPAKKNYLLFQNLEDPPRTVFFDSSAENFELRPIADNVESMEQINVEEQEEVPVHNYDPSKAYYNPHKYYDPASQEKIRIYPQKVKFNVKKEAEEKPIPKNIQNLHISTGNNNDIIFQALELSPNKKKSDDFGKSDPTEDNDNYILNFLKKKHRTSQKLLAQGIEEPKPTYFKQNIESGFAAQLQNLIDQNMPSKKHKRESSETEIFIYDQVLDGKKKKDKVPTSQTNTEKEFAKLNKYLASFLETKKRISNSERFEAQKARLSRSKSTIISKKEELKFLNNALDELFNSKSNYAKSPPKKQLRKKKNILRDDIALDYYFERNDGYRTDDNYDNGLVPSNVDIPVWEDNSNEATNVHTLQQIKKKEKNKKVTASKVSKVSAINSAEKQPDPKAKATDSGESNEKACAAKKEIEVHVNVLQDMIDTDSDALENFDWLGTTVDIQASLQRLEDLSQKYLHSQNLQPMDYQLFKFFVYLHKLSDERVKARPKCIEKNSEEIYRYEQNANEELIIAPRDFTLKRKKDSTGGDNFKLFNDYFFHLFKIKRRKGDMVEDFSDVQNFVEFVNTLRNDMYTLHMAIKNIAMITEYSSQTWYRDLKNIYLKSAKRKHLLALLLHISFTRVLDLVEVAIDDGIVDNYVKYIIKNGPDFEMIAEKTDFVKSIMQEMALL